jgi:predicted nucleic acid-binding protein
VTIPSASEVLLVDSSGWLEYLTQDSKADDFAPYLEGSNPVVVPTIVLYEVYKKLRMVRGKSEADQFAFHALRREVVPLEEGLALAAANASMEWHLGMADAIIYATAQALGAQLITSDQHFQGLPGVTLL